MTATHHLTDTERTIAIFAFRYALGRMTYAPSLVADYITAHLEDFTEPERRQMVSEIEGAERLNQLGHDCDVDTWLTFKNGLKGQKEANVSMQAL